MPQSDLLKIWEAKRKKTAMRGHYFLPACESVRETFGLAIVVSDLSKGAIKSTQVNFHK